MRTENTCDFILDSDLFFDWGSMSPDTSGVRAFGARFCEPHLKHFIVLAPPPHLKLRSAVPEIILFFLVIGR